MSLNDYGATKIDYTESSYTDSLIQFNEEIRRYALNGDVSNNKCQGLLLVAGSAVRDSGYSILFSAVTKMVSELQRQLLTQFRRTVRAVHCAARA
jgi:hypothetical protein